MLIKGQALFIYLNKVKYEYAYNKNSAFNESRAVGIG